MRKKYTTEKLYELICEENEHNPIVGTALYETKHFLMSLGFSKSRATFALQKIERQYDLHLYRRGHDHRRTDNGDVLNHEFGVTKTSNKKLYERLLNFYRKRLSKGLTKEQAIKATHEYYDPILAKTRADEPQTVDVDIFTKQVKTLSGTNKDLSNLEIEL